MTVVVVGAGVDGDGFPSDWRCGCKWIICVWIECSVLVVCVGIECSVCWVLGIID